MFISKDLFFTKILNCDTLSPNLYFGKPEIEPLHVLFRNVFSDVFELNYVELNEIDLTYQIVLMMAAYSIVEEAIHG